MSYYVKEKETEQKTFIRTTYFCRISNQSVKGVFSTHYNYGLPPTNSLLTQERVLLVFTRFRFNRGFAVMWCPIVVDGGLRLLFSPIAMYEYIEVNFYP